MIAEPYICIKGFEYCGGTNLTGDIDWFDTADSLSLNPEHWIRYADFEREKLKELGFSYISIDASVNGFLVADCDGNEYSSFKLIDYAGSDFQEDSESSRLLKRAEFLKAVCEKEGVEWLPNEKCHYCETGDPCVFDQTCPCPCKCHCACHGNPQDPCLCNGVECICKPEEPNVYKGDMKSVVNKFIDENKKPFWKGNKRREGTEHLT